MKFLFSNKKAVSEIISFVLLTLIVATASIIAYLFSTNLIDDTISKSDRDNMVIYLKKVDQKISSIINFEDSTTSLNLNFYKGTIIIENKTISYQSTEKYTGSSLCISKLCYDNLNGFEKISYNLTTPYEFDKNYSIDPGNFKITFKNMKNVSKIQFLIK